MGGMVVAMLVGRAPVRRRRMAVAMLVGRAPVRRRMVVATVVVGRGPRPRSAVVGPVAGRRPMVVTVVLVLAARPTAFAGCSPAGVVGDQKWPP